MQSCTGGCVGRNEKTTAKRIYMAIEVPVIASTLFKKVKMKITVFFTSVQLKIFSKYIKIMR